MQSYPLKGQKHKADVPSSRKGVKAHLPKPPFFSKTALLWHLDSCVWACESECTRVSMYRPVAQRSHNTLATGYPKDRSRRNFLDVLGILLPSTYSKTRPNETFQKASKVVEVSLCPFPRGSPLLWPPDLWKGKSCFNNRVLIESKLEVSKALFWWAFWSLKTWID